MIKVGKWIAKHKILIIIIGIALLIPSYLGMAATRINYDVLSYLPDTLETVDGQDIMVDQFGMGAFSMIVVEDMELKDVAALKEKIEAVDHVKKVLCTAIGVIHALKEKNFRIPEDIPGCFRSCRNASEGFERGIF